MSRAVVFDVGSSFGYFRKGFTTTSALTHALIPRSAIEGLVGAIVGLSSEEYPEKLYDSKIAVEIRSPVKKMNMRYMHTNPDWWQEVSLYMRKQERKSQRLIQFAVPASVEFLLNPVYRIYFDNEKVAEELATLLRKRETYYTPYLGTSSMICFTKYIGIHDYDSFSTKEHIVIKSTLPFKDKIPNIRLDKNLRFAIEEGLPIHVDKDRVPAGTYKVLYSPELGSISVADNELVEIHTEKEDIYVKFLPTQIAPG